MARPTGGALTALKQKHKDVSRITKTAVKRGEDLKNTDGTADNKYKPTYAVLILQCIVAAALLAVLVRISGIEGIVFIPDRNITEGTVIKHEIAAVNDYSTADLEKYKTCYRLYVEGIDDESKLGVKCFEVSEELYNYFEDGDWFNSATFLKEVAEQSEQEQ